MLACVGDVMSYTVTFWRMGGVLGVVEVVIQLSARGVWGPDYFRDLE